MVEPSPVQLAVGESITVQAAHPMEGKTNKTPSKTTKLDENFSLPMILSSFLLDKLYIFTANSTRILWVLAPHSITMNPGASGHMVKASWLAIIIKLYY
jgi:hypothetical protein